MRQRRPLNPQEKIAWLRLSRTEGIGPITFFRLLEKFGSAEAALEALPALAQRGGKKEPLMPQSLRAAEAELAQAQKLGWRLLAACEPEYPDALAAIEDAPPLLYVAGHPALLQQPCFAMVGARNASLNSKNLTASLAQKLGQAGLVIVSGLARGIDTAAHFAALPTGTVGCVAGGIDQVYPPENAALYAELISRGCIVSEMPPGEAPQARHFPRRNRIISGLSRGTLVVEAALQSGSLITARMALEQGRDVFAVPGSPMDPRARGSNNLLREGAILVETAEDVLRHIKAQNPSGQLWENDSIMEIPPSPMPTEDDLAAARLKILDNLSPAPIAVDDLLRECEVSASLMHWVLLELELSGKIERQRGNFISLIAEHDAWQSE